ncbi:DNRLRE domain-containing protein [Streptomyces sp. NPDC020965]|uniref:DNRLRE domain-containing protein n=1 Tax=Streptomyces sp. NPDC020965 TaxID=3365105 RepID=UPI0037A837B4
MRRTGRRVVTRSQDGARTSRRPLRQTALAVAAVLAAEAALVSFASGTAFAAGPGTAVTAPAAPAAKAAVSTAGSVAAAQLMARLHQRRIEVLPERTEDSTTWALPSGELQTSAYAGPIRQKVGGVWRDVDTALSDTGASLEPKVAAADITVSDGGDRALASVAQDGKSFAMGWNTTLPTPKVTGDTASYDLGAGQRLTVTALAQGFSQNVLLAKAPVSPPSYRIPVKLNGLKLSEADTGRLLLKDSTGRLVAEAPAPMMWDSSKDPASGESRHQAPVDTQIETAADGTQTLVLTPDAAYFDRDLTYPVTVDPTSTLAATTDTWVATNYNDSQVSSAELKSGTYDAGTTKARSYLHFDVARFKGKRITDTNLALYSYYSSTCATGAGTQVRRVTGAWNSSNITWAAQPATTTAGAVTSTAAKGYNASCPAGTIDFDVDAIVQAWADGQPNHGLRVAGASETDSTTWRRFRSANYVSGDGSQEPHLTVTYNSYPALPTGTAISPSQVNTYNGNRYVTSLTPTLSAKVSDPDGAKTRAHFEIAPDPAYADTTYTHTGSSAAVASGATGTYAIPQTSAIPAGAHLRYRVRAHDGTDYGPWTGWTTFVLNTVKPNAPAVTCDTYARDGWTPKAGGPVTCTLDTDSGDGAGYHWGLDDVSMPQRKLDTTNGSGGDALPISIAPADGWHTLYVRTVDSGGNLSPTHTAYSFGVGTDGAAVLSPRGGDTTARRLTLAATGKTSYTGVTWQYRRGDTDTWRTVPAGHVTAAGGAVASWPVPVTGGTATPLVWNTVSTLAEDGVIELRALFTDAATSGHSQTVEVTLDRDAGSAPAASVGPGTVNQLTGNHTLSATDAATFDAVVERTHASRANDKDAEGQAEIFGPGWQSSATADSNSYTQIRKTSATSVEVISSDGSAIAFTASAAGGWRPQTGAEFLSLSGSIGGTSFTLTDTDAQVTVFTKLSGTAPTWTLSSSAQPQGEATVTTVSETVTAGGKELARPKYVISPAPAATAAACRADASTRGCRSLEFVYAGTTTAAAGTLGDVTGQVKAIKAWATEPGATRATATTIAQYAYDEAGRLSEVWDPRISPALKTRYTYDAGGRVRTLTPPGELPWTFAYGTAGSALTAGAGMLLSATRPSADGGATGPATTSVVYDVPLTGTKAPHRMDAAAVGTWAQEEAPTDATAVFPAGSTPPSATGEQLTAADYERATITYINANGKDTNIATPGGSLTTSGYDAYGNTVSELTAANRALALGTADGADGVLAALGLGDLSTAERARQLATVREYSADGRRLTNEYGPLHQATLTKELTGTTGESTLPPGSVVAARAHTAYRYDENRPAGAAVSDLVTSTVTGAAVPGYASAADTTTVTTTYDWATGQEKSTDGGDAAERVTTYDATGRVSSSRTPGSSGSDAGTLTYSYYTADGSGVCGARPEWAGLLCRTAPAAPITGGGSHPDQAVTTVHTYDSQGRVATRQETANGVTRTTTSTRDAAGRLTGTTVSGGTGEPTPATTITYDQATGEIATQSAGGRTITHTYDALGRQSGYADGAGNTASTAYDLLDRPVKTTDSAPSTVSYTYDTAGNIATLTDSVAGVFTGTYDADGTLTTQKLPGGYTLNVATDTTGQETARTYTAANGTTVAADSADYTVRGQRASHTRTAGETIQSDYVYDRAGRLVQATDTTAGGCAGRAYAFDASSNRTKLTTTADDCDPATADAVTATTAYSYDTADRLVNSGYGYDAFGRTTTRGDTAFTYHTNDLVASETLGTDRNTWDLDAAGRLAVQSAQTRAADGSWTTTGSTVSHYRDGGDSPAWTRTGDSVSRHVQDLTGRLSALTSATGHTVLQLADIHGNITVQQPLDPAGTTTVTRHDEYGVPQDGATATTAYDWLGAFARSSATLSGATLMGARVYDPTTGRFLQTDPVVDGSPNRYGYVVDPVNGYDLGGRDWWKKKSWFLKDKQAKALGQRLIGGAGLIDALANYVGLIPHWLAKVARVAMEVLAGSTKGLGNMIKIAAKAKGRGVRITMGIWKKRKLGINWYYPKMRVENANR